VLFAIYFRKTYVGARRREPVIIKIKKHVIPENLPAASLSGMTYLLLAPGPRCFGVVSG